MPEDLEKKENQFADFEAPEIVPGKERAEEEKALTLEQKREDIVIEKKEEEEAEEGAGIKIAGPPAPAASAYKSPTLMQIEEILEEDLEDAYFGMPPEKKKEFKEKGEEAAGKIEKMIESVKVNSNKILSLIKRWLKLIPGINKFFLEQEAKIKTDKVLNLRGRK